jgi:hypothetical protein
MATFDLVASFRGSSPSEPACFASTRMATAEDEMRVPLFADVFGSSPHSSGTGNVEEIEGVIEHHDQPK